MDERMTVKRSENRNTICLEEAQILSQISHPGDQYILRLQAPGCALRASPGSFAHLTCDSATPLRRPLSIMRANAAEGWLEFLYKPVGHALRKDRLVAASACLAQSDAASSLILGGLPYWQSVAVLEFRRFFF
jgi:hypothetical protein